MKLWSQHKIIGMVTHTMEAQTPVTDKSFSDFMYKNFKQTEKLKKKYTVTKTKLKKTKQELEDVKTRKPESTMNKKTLQKGKFSTKVKVSKPTATTAATTSSSTTKPKVKTEPVSIIKSGDTSDENEADDGENITEVDSGESSSSVSTDSETDK